MIAIEFLTKIENDTIKIPKAYRGQFDKDVRVIVMLAESWLGEDMINFLLDHPLPLRDFQPMRREDIYA